MTLLQLQYFETLARVLHYTKAADELHISQPTLSYSINELEKELDIKLFEKENRKIHLTEYGERFLPYIQKSLQFIDDGKSMLKQMNGAAPMSVRLGYFHSISSSLIPAIMEDIYQVPENKNIRFQFSEDTSYDIFNKLKDGKLDLAFSTHRDDWAESTTILKQPLYLVVPMSHRLAGKPSVTFEDFVNEPLVVLDKASSLRTQFNRYFGDRGVIPNIVFEVRECHAALQYVALNFGVAILPQIPAMKDSRVFAIPIAESNEDLVRTIYLSWDRTKPLSPAAETVRDLILQHFSDVDPKTAELTHTAK